MLDVLHVEHPDCVVSISSGVLREYREYERSVTTLVDAAVKPKVAAYVTNIRRRLDQLAPDAAVLRHEEQRWRAECGRGRAPADHHDAVRPGRRRPGRRAHRPVPPGFDRILTCDGGGTSTDVTVVIDGEPALTTEGTVGEYPSKIPMIDVVTGGRRRRLDRLAVPGGLAQGRPPVGRRRPGPDVLPPAAARSRPSPTRTSCWPDPPAPARRGDPALPAEAARGGLEDPRRGSPQPLPRGGRDRDPGDLGLEPGGQRAAPGHRGPRASTSGTSR